MVDTPYWLWKIAKSLSPHPDRLLKAIKNLPKNDYEEVDAILPFVRTFLAKGVIRERERILSAACAKRAKVDIRPKDRGYRK